LPKGRFKKVAGVILAAGKSTRMGQLKQLALIGKRHLINIVIENALASDLDAIILVLGFEAERIGTVLDVGLFRERLKVIVNPAFEKGMSSSLITGLREVENKHDAVMFLLGDQPLVASRHINAIIDGYRRSVPDICVPEYGGKQGNPVLFDRRLYSELTKLRGDIGGRFLLGRQDVKVTRVRIEDVGQNLDIDTEADLIGLIEKCEKSSLSAWPCQ
jgi:molybdenum cofactor cytidylyltransferase